MLINWTTFVNLNKYKVNEKPEQEGKIKIEKVFENVHIKCK